LGGPYPYSTYQYLTGKKNDSGVFALDIPALASGATYYFVVKARPDADDSLGQIQSPEGACTTTTGSPYPASPILYKPSYPNTSSGYTTIPLTTAGGQFVAAATVTHASGMFCPSDPGWTVMGGDNLQTILNKVNFGAIIEFPQATTAGVPDTNNYNGGFKLPVITLDPCASGLDDPSHRWVILRTQETGAADFPPFGFRTGPEWAPKLANLQAQVPLSTLYTAGQIFWAGLDNATSTPIHHFWFSNLEFSVNNVASNGPWGEYFQFSNAEGDSFDAEEPASYIVLDRIYFSTPSPPAFSVAGVFGTVGRNVMLTGNYIVGFQQASALGTGIVVTDCSIGPLSILNNEIDAAGQGIYLESNSAQACGSKPGLIMQNVVVQRNAIYEPPSWLNPTAPGYGAWDGVVRGNFRNPFESKNCQICLITGNWIDGSFSGQNSGEAILIAPPTNPTRVAGASGAHDIEFSWNYIRHAAVIADVWGTEIIDSSGRNGPDSALTSNVLMHDNVAVDLGRHLYTLQGSVGGLASNYLNSYGVQNHLIYNNSFGLTNADSGRGDFYYIPAILGIGEDLPANGFQFQGNLLYLSQGNPTNYSGIGMSVPLCSGGCNTFPANPLPDTSSYATGFKTTMIEIGPSVVSSGKWGNNVIICGNKATGLEPWLDMDQNDCTTQAEKMPAGDIYPAGDTIAGREAAAGVFNVANSNLVLTPTAGNLGGTVGADMHGVLSELGIVKNIGAIPSWNSIQFTYTAPDSNTCSVDTSPDGTNWTRTADSGGSPDRTLLVTELPGRTLINYRVMCYYSQSRPWFSFALEPSNMATEGTVSTTPRVLKK
jgi:hypothetical protein